MWMGKAGASTDGDEAATVLRRNSRFIPEAERGWWQATREQRPETMRRSSSGTGGSTGLLDFRRTSWNPLTARWNSPRAKANSDVPEEGSGLDDVADEEGEQLDEDEEAEEGCVRSHARDRSNSVPHLPSLAKGESSSGSEREQLRQKSRRAAVPNTIDLSMTTFGSGNHIHSALPPTPLQLTHINSFTPSLELQRTLPQFASRGYEWRPDPHSKRKGYVPPSHRNPTAMQAFYDTHFGSSSGFRSVAGLADDIFHPIGSARQMLSRLVVVNGKREKKAKQNKADGDRNGAHDEQSKDTLTSWRMMPFSPAIFGMGSSPQAPELSTSKQSASHSASPGAYEPELIPTVHRDPHANRYFKHLEGNVVVLGGYRGSILRDAATHQMIWVPLKVGVGLRRPTLELGLSEEAEERSEELVIADEMLGGVGNMVDTGRRLITRCSRKRTKVHSWGYDWRLSLGRSSARLEAFLLQLWQDSAEKEGDRKGAKVVAHSMGGLVALHALARTEKPQIFESVVFASTPFLGTANILGPFAFGDAALWNDEICSPRATFSFRSSFYLLPVDPRGKEGVDTAGGRCFEEEDGRPHDVDFLDPETWNDLGLSPCVKRGMRPTVLQRAKERADKHGTSLGRQIEHSASQDANLQPTPSNRSDPVKDKADHVPAFPGPDMQMDPASNSQSNAAGVALSEAVKVGHSLAGGQDDSDQTLQPANRQNDNLSFSRKDSVGNTTHDDTSKHNTTPEDEDSISWAYLEKVSGLGTDV